MDKKIKILLVLLAVLLIIFAGYSMIAGNSGIGEKVTYTAKQIGNKADAAANSSENKNLPAVNPKLFGLYYPIENWENDSVLSISPDGTYKKIYPQKEGYLQLSGKWNIEENGNYHFVPDKENEQLRFVETDMVLFANLAENNHRETKWNKVSDNPEFPGVSPFGDWTVATDSGTARLRLDPDWNLYYILDNRSSTIRDEWWMREGDYIYAVNSVGNKSGIWDPLNKTTPFIKVDEKQGKMFFIDYDGGEIEMKRQ